VGVVSRPTDRSPPKASHCAAVREIWLRGIVCLSFAPRSARIRRKVTRSHDRAGNWTRILKAEGMDLIASYLLPNEEHRGDARIQEA
jgi:hypothetical protein